MRLLRYSAAASEECSSPVFTCTILWIQLHAQNEQSAHGVSITGGVRTTEELIEAEGRAETRKQ
jgi:hypothetical protein